MDTYVNSVCPTHVSLHFTCQMGRNAGTFLNRGTYIKTLMEVVTPAYPKIKNTNKTHFVWIHVSKSCVHPLIEVTLIELSRYHKLAATSSFPFPLTPIISHPDFAPGLTGRAFHLQLDLNLVRASFLSWPSWLGPSIRPVWLASTF